MHESLGIFIWAISFHVLSFIYHLFDTALYFIRYASGDNFFAGSNMEGSDASEIVFAKVFFYYIVCVCYLEVNLVYHKSIC